MFKFTSDGYKEALKYLIDTGNYSLLEKELSLDGYTVVSLANSLKYPASFERKFDGPVFGFDKARSK